MSVLRAAFVAGCVAAAILSLPLRGECDFVKIRGSEVNLREGPGKTFPVIHTARRGDELPLVSEEGLWYRVALDGGRHAFVFRQLAERKIGQPSAGSKAGDDERPSPARPKAGKGFWYGLLALLAAGIAMAARKRRELAAALHARLLDLSGSRRSEPFRYDDHPPDQDKWEI